MTCRCIAPERPPGIMQLCIGLQAHSTMPLYKLMVFILSPLSLILQACLHAISKTQHSMQRINIYDIYADVCLPKHVHNEVSQLALQLGRHPATSAASITKPGTLPSAVLCCLLWSPLKIIKHMLQSVVLHYVAYWSACLLWLSLICHVTLWLFCLSPRSRSIVSM